MRIAENLYNALIAAGVDAVGVSIGVSSDKSTWRIDYDGATDEQISTAKALVAAFDPNTPDLPGPTAKADLWRRATDVEAIHMAAALGQQTVRIQQIYAAATRITRDDELWTTLHDGMVKLFGDKRADELLAPSES